MAGSIIRVAEGAQRLLPAPWVLVRRVADEYRVIVNDPHNPNPVTLGERFGVFWTALLKAREHAKRLSVPVHAMGCEDT
jgi:hypothetical protein